MAKNQRKLQSELEKNLKAIDEGILQLETLEQKLNNAPAMSTKEKYEIEMKKEIKKLQRVRDYFRAQINNSEIKDKSKLQDARRRVEIEMERFRAHEKEFKKKQFSKKALQAMNKDRNRDGSGSDDGSDYGSNDCSDYDDDNSEIDYGDGDSDSQNDEDGNQSEEISEEMLNQLKLKDREFFVEVLDFFKQQASKQEAELEVLRNKKVKGPPKKQKEKQVALSSKVAQVKKMRDRTEEIVNNLEHIDLQQVKNLKSLLAQFMLIPESEEASCNSVKTQQIELEMARLMEIAEGSKKIQQSNLQMQRDQLKAQEIRSKVDLDRHKDVIKDYCRVEQTQVGNILDAQDYLGNWHLAIVIKEKNARERDIHFLPYNNHKRDETFTDEDSNKIAPAFTNTEIPGEPDKSFTTLREYLGQLQKKLAQQPPTQNVALEEKKVSQTAPSQQQQTAKPVAQQQPVQKTQQPLAQQNKKGEKVLKQKVSSEEEEKISPSNQVQQTAAPILFGGNMFAGPDPFSQLMKQNQLQQQILGINQSPSLPVETIDTSLSNIASNILSTQQVPVQQSTSSTNVNSQFMDKTQQVLELLEASYRNIPQPQDQEVKEAKHPVPLKEDNMFPTVPMFNRRENFSRFDLDTLFFAFYYQQGTYQQYLAAIELKKKSWMFHKKYHTWFRKAEPGEQIAKGQQQGKYIYFDYETTWSQKISQNSDIDETQFENELQIDENQKNSLNSVQIQPLVKNPTTA